ncbi:MAG TPA: glycosyltransferase family 39 protein [Chitinophagales bacterium]|nr:glycosyltransferase family 39 protein [Chitinophagales bacterium]
MIWAQALCIKIHGINEFSTRFPAALSAALTCLAIFVYIIYLTGNWWAALAGALVICTAQGYIAYHGCRYGEYDAMLALFTFLYLLFFFLYIETSSISRKNNYLLLFFASAALAVLTKGIAGLLFTPAVALYLLLSGQFIGTLKNKYFYTGAVGFLVIVIGYYLLREQSNPGYIQAVFDNELGGRFNKVNEGHYGPPEYYFHNLRWERFTNWHWLLILGIPITFLQTNYLRLRATLYCYLCALVFLLVISSSQSKLWWYDIPAYPLFAVIIGLTLHRLAEIISGIIPWFNKKAATIAICAFALAQPVYEAQKLLYYAGDDLNTDNFYALSYYLRDAAHHKKNFNNVTYLYQDYALQWLLYTHRLNEQGSNIHTVMLNTEPRLHAGQELICNQPDVEKYIENNYHFEITERFYNVSVYKILNTKSNL